MNLIKAANQELNSGNISKAADFYAEAMSRYPELADMISFALRARRITEFNAEQHVQRSHRPPTHSDRGSQRKRQQTPKKDFAIYTAIINGYDKPLPVPDGLLREWDHIIVSCTPEVEGVSDSTTIITVPGIDNDPTRTARFIKCSPHLLLPEYKATLWVDGNVLLKDEALQEALTSFIAKGTPIVMRRHPTRDDLLSELIKCHKLRKDSIGIMYKQVEHYLQSSEYSQERLYETNVIFRSNTVREIKDFNQLWWREIAQGSRRDQLSATYCLMKCGLRPEYFPDNTDIRSEDNKLYGLKKHTTSANSRTDNTTSHTRNGSSPHFTKFNYQTYTEAFQLTSAPSVIKTVLPKLTQLGLCEEALDELNKIAESSPCKRSQLYAKWILVMYTLDSSHLRGSYESSLQRLESIDAESSHIPEMRPFLRFIIRDASLRMGSSELRSTELIDCSPAISQNELIQDLLLSGSRDEKISRLNRIFTISGLMPVRAVDCGGDILDQLHLAIPLKSSEYTKSPSKVSIIVPCYNAGSTVETAILSLLGQTWKNLEVIAVDDQSIDDTAIRLQRMQRIDDRIKVIRLRKNKGPYVARNIGLKISEGDYVTVCDADDWSHPQKIEYQIRHLLAHTDYVANTACWFRSAPRLEPRHRFNQPFYKHINISSLMLKREVISGELGGWDSVRCSGDSELYKRLLQIYNENKVANLDAITSISRVQETSLTQSSRIGYPGYPYGARKEYLESYTAYHRKSESSLKYDKNSHRLYAIPRIMGPANNPDRTYAFDIVIGGDYRIPSHAEKALDYLSLGKQMKLRIGLFQLNSYDVDPALPVSAKLRLALVSPPNSLLVYGENVTAKKLIILDNALLSSRNKFIPSLEAELLVIYLQTPETMTEKQRENLHDISYGTLLEAYESPLACFQSKKCIRHLAQSYEFRFIDIQVLKTSKLNEFSYVGSSRIAVIMPATNLRQALKLSKLLLARSGIECTIIVALDDIRHGFIKTLNSVAQKVVARFICYLAQDAYPGRNWLANAFDDIEASQAGLLGFNDGKWQGRIASFGLVRRDWIHQHYGDYILYPGYKSHKADNEITVLARALNAYVYSPRSTLVEVDPEKDLRKKGSNLVDDNLFQTRFLTGFDGLVDAEILSGYRQDYKIKLQAERR